MPKTNIKGGKKKKRGKNGLVENAKIIFIEDNDKEQFYGQVSKILGSGRFSVSCFKKSGYEFSMEEKICLIRGKMRKRNWININDIVVVSEREFERGKGDIIHKYSNDETNILKQMKKIPNIDVNNKKENTEDINFNYTNENLLDSDLYAKKKSQEYFSFDYESISENESENE